MMNILDNSIATGSWIGYLHILKLRKRNVQVDNFGEKVMLCIPPVVQGYEK